MLFQRTRPGRFFGFLLTATLLFATAKCDSTPGVPEGRAKLDSISRDSSQSAARDGSGRPPLTRPPLLLEPEEYVSAELNGSSISLDQNGRIRNGKYDSALGETNFLFDSGIWVTGDQNGEKKVSLLLTSLSNYSSAPNGLLDSMALGPYATTRTAIDRPIVNWLDVAPLNRDGEPQMFGDAMMWSSLVPNPQLEITNPLWSKPVEELRIALVVYTFEDPALRNTFFVRYFVTNDSPNVLSDAFVGFRTDVDLQGGGSDCVSEHANSTGFIESSQISYTYDSRHKGDVDLAPGCRSVVTGFTFLASPTSQAGEPATSHTVIRKRNFLDPDFGETSLSDPTHADNMLRGLSVFGDQMVDSTTGLPTSFAFTGDPVAQTGWLDVSDEVRSLMSSGPFTLAPGESTSLVLAFVVSDGNKLSDAIQEMIGSLDDIRSDELLWDF